MAAQEKEALVSCKTRIPEGLEEGHTQWRTSRGLSKAAALVMALEWLSDWYDVYSAHSTWQPEGVPKEGVKYSAQIPASDAEAITRLAEEVGVKKTTILSNALTMHAASMGMYVPAIHSEPFAPSLVETEEGDMPFRLYVYPELRDKILAFSRERGTQRALYQELFESFFAWRSEQTSLPAYWESPTSLDEDNRITINVSKSTYRRIQAVARLDDQTLSSVAISAIIRFFHQNPTPT